MIEPWRTYDTTPDDHLDSRAARRNRWLDSRTKAGAESRETGLTGYAAHGVIVDTMTKADDALPVQILTDSQFLILPKARADSLHWAGEK